jgi:ssDNA thymidine ADP-ribosyltransferase, DarT
MLRPRDRNRCHPSLLPNQGGKENHAKTRPGIPRESASTTAGITSADRACGGNYADVDPRVTELHCIMPMANMKSVMDRGILSYERAAKLQHHSVALQPVQEKRDRKQIPGGFRLHQYANLYFHARNPMMFKRQTEAPDLCVLRVSTEVLGLEGAVISDQNAASDYVRFLHPRQWRLLDFDAIYAMDWRHPGDPIAYFRHSSQKCAEVLVPQVVDPKLLTGAYVVDDAARNGLEALGFAQPVTTNPLLFFR